MERKDPIKEAWRYVENAKKLLSEAEYDPETKIYNDSKYIRMAGDTLWKGCLIALEAVFNVRKNAKKYQRIRINDYKEAVSKRDQKLLTFVNCGYDTMHLCMGYDGNKNKKVCEAGFENASTIIRRCETMYRA